MSDMLNMELINSLPQPLWVKESGHWWPVQDIDVQSGLLRIDVCGMLQSLHIGGAMQLRDDSGAVHDSDDLYLEEVECGCGRKHGIPNFDDGRFYCGSQWCMP
jgi:hypothetical protein